MPLLQTPRNHFDDDTLRARALNTHAGTINTLILKDDVARAAWMMAVGAVDAYFCDAYADLCARALQAKQLQTNLTIPDALGNLQIPAFAVIRPSASDNWRWRMATREMIEKHTVLSLKEVKGLFNRFCRDNHKLFSNPHFDAWIVHRSAPQRLFGVSASRYRQLRGSAKSSQRDDSRKTLDERFGMVFQRRHDCIHNCDRPKVALVRDGLSMNQIGKVIDDVTFLVGRFEDVMLVEFPLWLDSLGINAATKARVLQ